MKTTLYILCFLGFGIFGYYIRDYLVRPFETKEIISSNKTYQFDDYWANWIDSIPDRELRRIIKRARKSARDDNQIKYIAYSNQKFSIQSQGGTADILIYTSPDGVCGIDHNFLNLKTPKEANLVN